MASVHALMSAKSILGFRGPPPSIRARISGSAITVLHLGFNVSPLHCSNFRFKDATRLRSNQRSSSPIFASNTDSSGTGDSVDDKSQAIETSTSSPRGPPFLTILAGFVTLIVLLYILGFIVMWLVGLIVK